MEKLSLLVILLLCSTLRVSAQVNDSQESIQAPEDARKHGLQDLRKAKRDVPQADLSKFLNPGKEALGM